MAQIVRLEEAQRVTLFRLTTEQPNIRLSLPVVRYVQGAKGDPGPRGEPGTPGADSDGLIGAYAVDLVGLGPFETIVYDPGSNKFVNGIPRTVQVADGGAF